MWCKKILALCLVLVMCIPAFSGMNVSAGKTNKKEATNICVTTYLVSWDYLMDHLRSFIYTDGTGMAG